MIIGITVGKYEGIPTSRLLRVAQLFGVEFVEFNRSLLEDLEAICRQIGDTASGYHLPLVEEDGFDFSCRDHIAEIDRIIETLNANIERLNLRYALTHPPQAERAHANLDDAIPFWIDNLKRLQLPVLLENVTNWEPGEFDRLASCLQKNLGEQYMGICFDGPHALLRGDDVFARFRELAPQVRGLHLSDCSETEDLHQPFHRGGVFPIEDFLALAKELRVDAILNLEIDPGSLDNLGHLLKSYLLMLQVFDPMKYYTTRVKLVWAVPRIKREVKKIIAEFTAS